MSNLTNNTSELRDILAAVNALPESSGGITPSGTKQITENGTYDVTNYASAEVNVPSEEPVLQKGSATPTKSQQTINPPSGVDGFSEFVVEKIPDSYVIPSGTKTITANGNRIDVSKYSNVNVNVPTGGSGEIETCTVVFNSTGFNMGYTNGNQTYIEGPITEETTLTVAKNTLLWTYGGSETHTGSIEVPTNPYDMYLFLITGDGTINIGD